MAWLGHVDDKVAAWRMRNCCMEGSIRARHIAWVNCMGEDVHGHGGEVHGCVQAWLTVHASVMTHAKCMTAHVAWATANGYKMQHCGCALTQTAAWPCCLLLDK